MLQVVKFYHQKVAELGVAIPGQQAAAEDLQAPSPGDADAPAQQVCGPGSSQLLLLGACHRVVLCLTWSKVQSMLKLSVRTAAEADAWGEGGAAAGLGRGGHPAPRLRVPERGCHPQDPVSPP